MVQFLLRGCSFSALKVDPCGVINDSEGEPRSSDREEQLMVSARIICTGGVLIGPDLQPRAQMVWVLGVLVLFRAHFSYSNKFLFGLRYELKKFVYMNMFVIDNNMVL